MQQGADDRRRQEGDEDAKDKPPRLGVAKHSDGNVPQLRKVDAQQRKDRAQLNQDRKGVAEILVAEAEKVLQQKEMSGR